MRREWVGPAVAEQLGKLLPCLPGYDSRDSFRVLPDGQAILVGTEWVYAQSDNVKPCAIDLGGDVPMVLWKAGGA